MAEKANYKSHLFRLIGLLIGAAIFVYTIHSFGGFRKLAGNLVELKWYYLLVIINSFVWMLFYTYGWKQLFINLRKPVKFISLLKVKLCGEGVNFMTPLGFLAGDSVRVLLLKKYVGTGGRLRSVLVDRLMHSLSAQVFCLGGALLIFTQKINFPVWLHALILAVYSVLCLVFFTLLYSAISGRGFGFFERVFLYFKIEKRLPKLDSMFHELRENLKYYHGKSKWPFVVCFLCHFMGRILGAVEILIVFYCYAGHADIVFAIILTALTSFFSIAMGWIPGAFGALEYMYAQFFMLYGFSSDIGLSVQIVRRLRVFFWIGVGILLLDYVEIGNFFNKFKRKSHLKNLEQKN